MTKTLEIKFTPLEGYRACPITVSQIGYFTVHDKENEDVKDEEHDEDIEDFEEDIKNIEDDLDN